MDSQLQTFDVYVCPTFNVLIFVCKNSSWSILETQIGWWDKIAILNREHISVTLKLHWVTDRVNTKLKSLYVSYPRRHLVDTKQINVTKEHNGS